ncbi:hypothetical protein SC10_B2orf01140 [Bacillus paralicheniformis]|nr:hypothetical protein SC10_B2orf01140 [Bacillus paralicheniformis]
MIHKKEAAFSAASFCHAEKGIRRPIIHSRCANKIFFYSILNKILLQN